MKILITGGAGFIGSNLVSYYLKKGDNVFIIDNLITGSKKNIEKFLKDKRCHFFQEDITTFDFAPLTFNFDVIYHLASPASPLQYKKYPLETIRTNSLGTMRLLEFCRKNQATVFVLASTSEVYGDPQVHPQKESYFGNVNTLGARACYDESKRFAETIAINYFRKFEIKVRIARIFNTYGPNMEKNDGRVISNFITQAIEGKPITIFGDGSQTRSFCYISDMVYGLVLLADYKNDGEVFNLGNPDERKIIDLAKLIKKMINSNSEIVFFPIDKDDPKRRRPEITKAKKILGWKPQISLEEGLKKTINYFKERFF